VVVELGGEGVVLGVLVLLGELGAVVVGGGLTSWARRRTG